MKKLYAVFLSLVMMFAFASTAMAAEAPTLTIIADGKVLADAITVNVGESVYDAVDRWAKEDAKVEIDWTSVPSDIGDGTGQVLVSLDGKGSVPYNSPYLDEYEYYDSSVKDLVLERVNAALLKAFPDSDGLGLWMGNGVGYSNDGPYMAYVGDDWTFTVNSERPVDTADPSVELYMNQAIINAGDVIVLTYGETIEVWNYQE